VLTNRLVMVEPVDDRLSRSCTTQLNNKGRQAVYQPYPGSAQMPETTRPSAPASVRNAVKVMYAGAAASIIGIIIGIATAGATKNAIARHSPTLTASQVNSTEHILVAGAIVGGVIGAALWIIIARSCQGGKNWARITGTVFFAIATLNAFGGFLAPIAAVSRIWTFVIWLIGLTAVVLLWQRSSTDYFKSAAPS
jgi:hypothetical protein